ncbi:LytR/AlgR family response regulator transcription factor [Plebeiibacterium sediminum]|uniref:LytTR family transcriptional regulator n=1 Tax=Plebeiibacterium sediminum TaxID=2992112 RepID=A0AAE3SFP3_9BACT|nr:LytTR family DNA-binding domain-containing protein [Plebeiobacterium sediminum]MCW3787307.1 LytTR family transcriptional regulator [Plebeiobacterium sediminum]
MLKIVSSNRQIEYPNLYREPVFISPSYRNGFLVNKKHKYFMLKVCDIAYFIFENKNTYAVSFDKTFYNMNKTLESIETELNPADFFRTSRNTIINKEAFDNFELYFNGKLVVKLQNNLSDNIVISRAKAAAFKCWLDK